MRSPARIKNTFAEAAFADTPPGSPSGSPSGRRPVNHAAKSRAAHACRRSTCGFSLLELLAAIVIVTTLLTMATPLYRKHAQQIRYLDGQTRLLELMDLEHRHYAQTSVYIDDFRELGLSSGESVSSARGHYRISAAACKGNLAKCVKLTASPANPVDSTLTLDSQGRRTPAGAW